MKILRIVPYIFFSLVVQYNTTNEIQSQSLPEELVIDEYHGQKVEDPYRYMENSNDSSVINWYLQQEKRSKDMFGRIPKGQDALTLKEAFDKKDSIKTYDLNVTNNNFYFYLKRNTNSDLGKRLYYRKGLKGKEKFLYDPKTFRAGNLNNYSINYFKPSWDGTKVAISLTRDDQEISEIVILDTWTRKRYLLRLLIIAGLLIWEVLLGYLTIQDLFIYTFPI